MCAIIFRFLAVRQFRLYVSNVGKCINIKLAAWKYRINQFKALTACYWRCCSVESSQCRSSPQIYQNAQRFCCILRCRKFHKHPADQRSTKNQKILQCLNTTTDFHQWLWQSCSCQKSKLKTERIWSLLDLQFECYTELQKKKKQFDFRTSKCLKRYKMCLPATHLLDTFGPTCRLLGHAQPPCENIYLEISSNWTYHSHISLFKL